MLQYPGTVTLQLTPALELLRVFAHWDFQNIDLTCKATRLDEDNKHLNDKNNRCLHVSPQILPIY